MYILISEDMTHASDSMGSAHTSQNWLKHFSTKEKAKRYAEKDYKNPIKWKGNCSGDLLYVMYTIEKVKITK